MSAIEEFAEAVSAQTSGTSAIAPLQLDRVTVLGGGGDARMLAALCLAEGADVTLFSAYGRELDALRTAGGVTLRGDGPVGTYQVDRTDAPAIATTAELDKAVDGAQVIFLTGPVHKQRTYAMVLADHVQDGQVLVLAPGRSLGAAEAAWLLRVGGRRADITIVETQGLPYWFEASGGTLNLSAAAPVSAAALPANRQDIVQALSRFLPNITPAISTIHSGFADGSGLVEVPALLLGGPAVGDGMPDVATGGVALDENKNFRTLIGAQHLSVMGRMAQERTDVAQAFGVRDLPTLDNWLDIHAGAAGGPGTRPIPQAEAAAHIVRCATIGSLVPLASAAAAAGIDVPATGAMIALAATVLEADIASAGRKLETIGIGASGIEDARRILDDIASGGALMDDDLKSVAAARRCAESAFEAYRKFLGTDPKQIDAIVDAMARAIEPEAKRLGALAVEETGYGNVADKRVKNLFNALSVADYLRDITTLGILWRDDATKIAAIGEPMGVVAALVPVTNPTSTIIFKVLSAVKAGNAIVCAPHPRGVRCGVETVRIMADVAEQMGAPKGLIQCLDHVTIQGTAELMQHRRTSVVMATGGPGMVKAAYSSGKPTLAVGAGNVPCYVHASKAGQIGEVAEQIVTSKSFDYGTACVSEQAVIADKSIARELRHELKLHGAYFCTPAESDRLAKVIFSGKQAMNVDNVGQSPESLAAKADFSIPPRTRCLVSDEIEIGWQRPLSAEKLNPVLAFYEARDTDHGIELSNAIATFEGWGHSSVIHCDDPQVVARYSAIPTGRVLVNTPAIMGGMGYSTDLEPSFMLGTGTWSGSMTSDNVTALHLINIKRVAYESRPWRDIYDEYGE